MRTREQWTKPKDLIEKLYLLEKNFLEKKRMLIFASKIIQ